MYSKLLFQKVKDSHSYTAFELCYSKDKEAYLKYILPVLKEEYGLGESLDAKIEALSEKRKEAVRKYMTKYITPDPDASSRKRPPQLEPTRSKIAEIIAKDYLKKNMDVSFACRLSLEEEDSDMPKKGIDNFGFVFKKVGGNIELVKVVICEVKASDASKNPPDVVDKNVDSLYNTLLGLSNANSRLKKALAKSFDRFDENEYVTLIADLMIDLEENDDLKSTRSKMIVVPFLLRTKDTYKADDFGMFYDDPSEFDGTSINYYIMVLDVPLATFANELYSELRGEANE